MASKKQPKPVATSGGERVVRIACSGAAVVELDKLTAFQGGLKDLSKENYEKLRLDIIELGFSEPVSCWKHPDGKIRILNGHQRVRALTKMREDGWTVPPLPVSWVEAADEREARMKVLSLTSQFGEITGEGLSEFMTEGGIEFEEIEQHFRFAELDLEKFWANFGPEPQTGEDPGANTEAGEALAAKWATALGQVWEIGAHRLMCGDSTKAEDVARLMDGQRAALMATDPPYGVAYTDDTRVAADRAHVRQARMPKWEDGIDNDEKTGEDIQPFLEACFRAAIASALEPTAAWYLWHAHKTQAFFAAAAAAAANLVLHRQIIWVKPSLLFGFGDYHWRHELCFYGWVQGHRPPFYGERNQTSVWEITNETSNGKRVHPTQKPVEIFAIPMRNHTKPGEVCFEPFGGSGSQLVAAEQLGRRCFAMELDPRYAAVILERMAGMGLQPKLVESRAVQAA